MKYKFESKPTLKSTSHLQDASLAYIILSLVFPYLKLRDLRCAMRVCTIWWDVAVQPLLWKKVQMNNFQILNLEGLRDVLKKNETVHLDFREIYWPDNRKNFWIQFTKEIIKVDTLRKIELCCPTAVIKELIINKPRLEVINAILIQCQAFSLAPVACLKNLTELHLKPTYGTFLISGLDELTELKDLQHLSLTAIENLNTLNLQVIARLTNLKSLALGKCQDFPKPFGSNILARLSNLKKLRLEMGINFDIFEILDVVKTMPHIQELELINFDIEQGFDFALSACTNIKKLLIIPIFTRTSSFITIYMILRVVLGLSGNLSHFMWGITHDHVEVSKLYVDQCQRLEDMRRVMKDINGGGCIPFLKPVPFVDDNEDPHFYEDKSIIEIISFKQLQKMFFQLMPKTHVKMLTLYYCNILNQTIANNFY